MKTKSEIKLLIDFGLQPISNRYLPQSDQEEKLFPLKLGQCQSTGLIQLIDPVPAEELVPKYDWITYFEPENHLDSLVDRIYKSYFSKKNPIVGGISYKDDSTLMRFEALGCKSWRVDPTNDLNLGENAGVESVQASLNVENSKEIATKKGKAGLLVVRHIWEHIHDQNIFVKSLKELVVEDGYILFEVPDCSNLISSLDYTMPWEEHLYYYTPSTLKQSIKRHGFEIIDIESIPHPYENSIVVLVKFQTSKNEEDIVEINELKNDKSLHGRRIYGEEYIPQKKMIFEILSEENRKRKIMLFGAGHISGAFINHYSLNGLIDCVVDDDSHKQGLFMPKSGLPIINSKVLIKNKSSLCLLAVNPIHEEKIISKQKRFLQQGGEFRSICPLSKYSFY